jgi:hypothetical protein
MRSPEFPARLKRVALAIAGLGVAALSSGATPYEYAVIGKNDRLPSIADCRDPDLATGVDCQGIELPITQAETIAVKPGLSLAAQVNG